MAFERIKSIKARKPARCGYYVPKGDSWRAGCGARIAKGEYHYRSTLARGGSDFPETHKICAECFRAGVRQSQTATLILER